MRLLTTLMLLGASCVLTSTAFAGSTINVTNMTNCLCVRGSSPADIGGCTKSSKVGGTVNFFNSTPSTSGNTNMQPLIVASIPLNGNNSKIPTIEGDNSSLYCPANNECVVSSFTTSLQGDQWSVTSGSTLSGNFDVVTVQGGGDSSWPVVVSADNPNVKTCTSSVTNSAW